MSGWVFLAHAVSRARADDDAIASAVEHSLTEGGVRVRRGGSAAPGLSDAEITRANIAAVIEARAVVLVAPPDSGTVSSVWIELGMAVAAQRPIVVVAHDDAHLPFLLRGCLEAYPEQVVLLRWTGSYDSIGDRVLNILDSTMHVDIAAT